MKRHPTTATRTAQRSKKSKPPTKAAKPSAFKSKLDLLVELMRAKSGASIDQLAKAIGWQKHSVRSAISGALKRRGGLKIMSERIDGVRVYRIVK